jgi:hypothetical protein
VLPDQTVRNRLVHETPGTRERRFIEVGPYTPDAAKALVEDGVGPSRAYEPGMRQPQKQVAQRRREQDASVVDYDERHQ